MLRNNNSNASSGNDNRSSVLLADDQIEELREKFIKVHGLIYHVLDNINNFIPLFPNCHPILKNRLFDKYNTLFGLGKQLYLVVFQ